MKELFCINIGQAGVQLSNAIWELFCLEHGINVYGERSSEDLHSCESIFQETCKQRYTPRCLTIDLEPTAVDEIRTGIYRQLFSPSQLISGFEDSSCNFARGNFTIGKLYLESFLSTLRRMMEQCDSLQGLVILHSIGGGCGSGFTSLASEHMSIEYAKTTKMQFSILPSRHMTSSIVEPYNFILSSKTTIEMIDMSFGHDNQSLLKILHGKLFINSPSFTSINRLLAQVFSSVTVSVRYENALNNDICQIATNIIPFPRLHYLINSYAPICDNTRGRHYVSTTMEITKDVFSPSSKLIDCNFVGERFISCCLQYRGNISPIQVNQVLLEIKKKDSIKFVDWCPTGFKIGINRRPSVIPKCYEMFDTDNSVLLMCNNTSFHQKIGQLITKFNILYRKRSFVHWFVGEGMEEGEFVEAKDDFTYLLEDYQCLFSDDQNTDRSSMAKFRLGDSVRSLAPYIRNSEIDDNIPLKSFDQKMMETTELMNSEIVYKESHEVDFDESDDESEPKLRKDKSFTLSAKFEYLANVVEQNEDDDDEDDDLWDDDNETVVENKKPALADKNSVKDSVKLDNTTKESSKGKQDDRLNRLNKYLNHDTDSTHTEISTF